MTGAIQTLLLLLVILVIVDVAAQRLHLARSILLVVAGIALAVVPGLPHVRIAPEFMLLVVLPPLIYTAGVQMSWREFRFNLRPISLLAIGSVVFTACAVALAAHALLGIEWAVGFVLGAIVAPPDLVAPLAIARGVRMPRRLLVILEGEGLANDATALILYRFAVAAVSTGVFSLGRAAEVFGLIVVGELIYGTAVGWASLHLRRWARNPRVEITISLITPYVSYWLPEHLGGSGVLATVACGLYVSWNGPLLISSATRLQGIFFWDFIVYLIEGLVFLLMGLQLRTLLLELDASMISQLITATAITTAIVIVARFVWMFPATYLPRWLSPSLARRDPSPPWQYPFALAFTGVRGVVSLSAAFAIPLTTADFLPFPDRELILFVTFGVILITLVGQGLALPSVFRWLGLDRIGVEENRQEQASELAARNEALELAQRRLDQIAAERNLPDDVLAQLRARHYDRAQQLPKDLGGGVELTRSGADIRLELIDAEREHLSRLLREGKLTDESRRRIERELDLEEATISSLKERQLTSKEELAPPHRRARRKHQSAQ
ncbi:MAG: Na+/H+ antiporter [Myxococcales bacterium]|nr:Na+/H+ antiporter [Myxococcales bacterium]